MLHFFSAIDPSLADDVQAFAMWLKSLAFVEAIKFSRWGYSIVNTAHVIGIALLVGSILPLDLRMLGVWRGIDRAALARVIVPIAALGLTLALCSGVLLFSVRAMDYVKDTLFVWKFGLIFTGAFMAILIHVRTGWWMTIATQRAAAIHGAVSLVCWFGALVCGRMIAYFPG